jgi:hypothetical protein
LGGNYGWAVSFDGKQFSRWEPAYGPPVRLGLVESVFGARNGDLFIGAQTGIFRLSNGTYFKYEPRMIVGRVFTEDDSGRVWLAKSGVHSSFGLCLVGQENLKCYGPQEGLTCSGIGGVALEGSAFWLGGPSSVCRWSPGQQSQDFLLGNLVCPAFSEPVSMRETLSQGAGHGTKKEAHPLSR